MFTFGLLFWSPNLLHLFSSPVNLVLETLFKVSYHVVFDRVIFLANECLNISLPTWSKHLINHFFLKTNCEVLSIKWSCYEPIFWYVARMINPSWFAWDFLNLPLKNYISQSSLSSHKTGQTGMAGHPVNFDVNYELILLFTDLTWGLKGNVYSEILLINFNCMHLYHCFLSSHFQKWFSANSS